MNTNLPSQPVQDSAESTKLFFDAYGQRPLEFNTNEIDACIGFFTSYGFDTDAATNVSSVLLKQAKLEGLPIFKILDSIRKFNGLQISALVSEILNNNRAPSSTLGFKVTQETNVKNREISA